MTTLIFFEYIIVGGTRSLTSLLWGITPLVIFLTGTTWIFSGHDLAIAVFLRVLSGAVGFSFFVSFTNPSDLTRLMETLKIPPKWALIPSLSLTFVPRTIKDAQETLETLSLRGEIGGRRNVLTWLPRILAIFIASTLYRSEFLAQALYFRGFGLPSRTHYRKVVFERKDVARALLWLLGLIILPQINYWVLS